MWIGNDIVDLKQNQQHHPRFPRRIFSDSDLDAYHRNGSQPFQLWLAWAVKEAAYKLEKQRDSSIFFSPPEFSVDLQAATVTWRGRVHIFECDLQDEYLHVWIHAGAGNARARVKKIPGAGPLRDESLKARDLAAEVVGEMSGIEAAQICIESDSQRIPFVYRMAPAKVKLPFALSLSHDGRYVAVAVASR